MTIAQGLLQELEQEAKTTRRLLERVPDSRTVVAAAREVVDAGRAGDAHRDGAGRRRRVRRAAVAGAGAGLPGSPGGAEHAELLRRFDESIAKARTVLTGMDDAAATEMWRMVAGEREVMAMPRVAFMRAIMLNHWYHHRGQLSVYLRFLGVPLPSIYGPTADENPFA